MAKRADADLSGLNPDFVISQAKPGNRVPGRVLKAYDPSAAEPAVDAVGPPEPAPVVATPPAAEPTLEQDVAHMVVVKVKETEPANGTDTPKEESRRRKNKPREYEALFFKDSAIKTRSGKVVYIRKEYHDRILKIVRVIGENEFSLFSYLDNILENHFSTWQDDITELYRKKHTEVF